MSEDFFISMIRSGLLRNSDALSLPEELLLSTSVFEALSDEMSEEQRAKLQQFQARCIGALSDCYARGTARDGAKAALVWRGGFDRLQSEQSDKVIWAIAQEWYLRVGRAQEKHATGYVYWVAGLFAVLILIVLLFAAC